MARRARGVHVIFGPTPLSGVVVIEPERIADERGHFARTFAGDEFAAHGLEARVVQCSTSFNRTAGTLRGLHYQSEPHGEAKLVRCTRGAVFDVAVDLRPASPTFRRWFGVELSAENGFALSIAEGLAHGFQTLVDATEVLYQMSSPYVASAARGVRWDDPAFAIEWPRPDKNRVLSARDAAYPDFAP